MPELVRLSISLEEPLARALDRLATQSRCENRSEFVRELIRARLVEDEWVRGREVLGTVTLVYDHHRRGLGDKLTALQHEHHASVLAATHIHLDHDICAEMIMLRGKPGVLRKLADGMRGLRGVLHASLTVSSTGKRLRKE